MSKKEYFKIRAEYKVSEGKTIKGESKTQPDEDLSIKDLIAADRRGVPMSQAQFEPMYFGEEEVPMITDLTDLQKFRQAIEDKKKAAKEAARRLSEFEAKLADDAKFEQRVKEERKKFEEYKKKSREREIEAGGTGE